MLVHLSIKNFGPIGEEPFEFSMETQQHTEKANAGKDYVVEIDSTECPYIMTSAGIFGPNASGKTTILRALRLVEHILTKSHKFDKNSKLPDEVFKFSDVKDSFSEIDLIFLQNNFIYQYILHFNKDKIKQEILNCKEVGKGKKWILWIDRQQKYLSKDIIRNVWGDKVLKNADADTILDDFFWHPLNQNQSVISELHNKDNVNIFDYVYTFFDKIVMTQGDGLPPIITVDHLEQYKREIIQMLNVADFGVEDILYIQENQYTHDKAPRLLEDILSKADRENSKDNISIINANGRIFKIFHDKIEEYSLKLQMKSDMNQQSYSFKLNDLSAGTRAFFAYAGVLLMVLKNEGIICIDEIERSLHPYLTKHIVDMFNDSDINTHRAQLIFTSHDVSLLHKKTLQPEQVYFTNKSDYTLQSELYSLAEFNLKK